MRKRKPKPSGLRKYWPHLTLKECEIERQKLSDAQHQKCAICNRHEGEFQRRLSVDHNHRTFKIRGLLCFYCNRYRVGRNSLATAFSTWQYLLKFDPEGG